MQKIYCTSLFTAVLLAFITHNTFAQTTWTGATSSNWATPANWSAGVPDAADDVTIPNVTLPNVAPVIMGGTAALAQSVWVQTSAALTINAMGSLTINGSGSFSGSTAGFYNEGIVSNSGSLTIGSTTSVGGYGLWNRATFNNNTGGQISIDRSLSSGLYNEVGTFTNAAKITIGAVASVSSQGIYNRATFNNNTGGQISIDRSSTSGLYNEVGTFTNAATITIGATASVGQYSIQNRATFNNTGGQISIDRSSTFELYNERGGTFTNAATITIGATASAAFQGIYNEATFNNNTGGQISIDSSSRSGLYNLGTFTNTATITIGAKASVGFHGINNDSGQATFHNNTGGQISIDRSSDIGLLNNYGIFTNEATITIGATASVGDYGIQNKATFNNTGGQISIDRSSRRGLYNLVGTFTNAATITIGATASVGREGIRNTATFNNSTCSALVRIVSDAIIRDTAGTFTNAGLIIENASGNSNITSNTGVIQNLNGGTFTTGGTAAITTAGDIWTGCVSTDWATAGNWADGSVPTVTDEVVIPNVTNDPTINAAGAVAKSVHVQASAVLTITSAGSLTIDGSASRGILNEGTVENSGTITIGATASAGFFGIENRATFNNNTGGQISIDRSSSFGIFNFSGSFTNTATFTNAAKITIGAVANVGTNGIRNEATFNNSTGGQISIDRSSSTGLYNSGGTFTNAATITIGATASVGIEGIVNQATFNNNTGGEISIGRSSNAGLSNGNGIFTNAAKITIGAVAAVGAYGIRNDATFNNNSGGEISIDRSTNCGLYNGNSPFTNAAKITIGAVASVGDNGIQNYSTFNNNSGGEISIDRSTFCGLYNANGTFTNAVKITIGAVASVGIYGILNTATFNNNSGGEISIDRSTTNGLGNFSGTFTNAAKITIGSVASVGSQGIRNTATFNNSTCSALVRIVSDAIVRDTAGTFTNAGLIIENASGNSNITSNTGIVQNLGGGTFTIGSGNPPTTATGPQDPCCLTFSITPANVTIINSTCNTACTAVGGSIVAPTGAPCPTGSTLEYQVNDGAWTTTLPVYAQAGPAQTIKTRCSCDATPTTVSAESIAVTTAPANCTDNTPPTITCPANTTVLAGATCAATLASYTAAATANDNCTANPSKTQSPVAGTIITGSQVVTLTATDAANNSATCTFTVTVVDQTVPSITCPANAIIPAGATCAAILTSYKAAATANDNCTANPSKTQSPVAGTTITGSQVVTLTATDAANNSATCTFTVTVVDQTVPSITCPANAIIPAGATCAAILTSYKAAATANDNCTANPSKIQSPVAGTTITGSQVVALTATDAANNSATCTFTVTVVDQTTPSITCPANTTVLAGATCAATLASYTAAATANDNCTANPSKIQSPVSGTTITGSQVVTLTATDGANNSAACTFTVTVVDATAPTVICKNFTTNLNATGTASINTANVFQSGSDNCGAVNQVSVLPNAFTCANVGVNTVVLTVSDGGNNTATCSAIVTVVDATAPTIICPANIVRANDLNQCNALVAYPIPIASDNCAGAVASHFSGGVSGAVFQKGTTIVIWRATDGVGLTGSCSFSITVNDTQKPNITCPANQTRSTDLGQCSAVVTYPTPKSTDNCDLPTGQPVWISGGTNAAGSTATFQKGATIVIWRATDAAGNIQTCTFRVTVNDTQAPTMTCPAAMSINTTPNLCSAVATYTNPSFTDNCAPTTGTAIRINGLVSGSAFPLGNSNVVFQATDAAGNTRRCTMVVTVVDNQPPVVTCPPSIVITGSGTPCTSTVFFANATASDNCAGTLSPFLLTGLASGSAFPAGVTTNTFRAVAPNGQSANCSFTVTVNCGSGMSNEGLEDRDKELEALQTMTHKTSLGLTIAPNPAIYSVTMGIEGVDANGGTLLVFDQIGRLVQQQVIAHDQRTTTLQVAEFASGLYRIMLKTDDGMVTKTLVVVKE